MYAMCRVSLVQWMLLSGAQQVRGKKLIVCGHSSHAEQTEGMSHALSLVQITIFPTHFTHFSRLFSSKS